MIKSGDYVTRKSHNNDIVFKVIKMENNICYLKGLEIRLVADAEITDLVRIEEKNIKREDDYADSVLDFSKLNRSDYFYMPGKVLHIDGDTDYLKRCMDFYKKAKVLAFGRSSSEKDIHKNITTYLNEINPDIVVITGHDAYYSKKKEYKNSNSFIKAVREARKYEKSSENLIIIAGACQSDYENLIKSGATFASSPKRINIHALDPAVIAVSLSYYEKGKEIDLIKVLSKTKYGIEGMGGIKAKGTMYTGYPRNGE